MELAVQFAIKSNQIILERSNLTRVIILFNADSILYGPYENSDTTLMKAIIGYKAQYSPHVNQSELCATCHTLFTPTLNEQGNIVGNFRNKLHISNGRTAFIHHKIFNARIVICRRFMIR